MSSRFVYHTMGVGVAVASVALGATFIGKHITLRRIEWRSGFSFFSRT